MIHHIQNWGFIKYCQIEFQNPFANLIYKFRLKKTCKYWNDNIEYINTCIKYNQDKENYSFKWTQLVNQEGFMYCKLGKQVEKRELLELCERRGFTEEMTCFLINWLKYIGIGKNL